MKLTVGEILEQLKDVPSETEITLTMCDGCCGDYLELELVDFRVAKLVKDLHYVDLRVGAIEGYQTCMQSGATKNRYTEKSKTETELRWSLGAITAVKEERTKMSGKTQELTKGKDCFNKIKKFFKRIK